MLEMEYRESFLQVETRWCKNDHTIKKGTFKFHQTSWNEEAVNLLKEI